VNFAQSVGRRLPFPRDLAAAALWHDVGALVQGRPPGGLSVAEARLRHDLARCRDLLDSGHAQAAIEAADALLAAAPTSVPVLRLKLDAEMAAGRSRGALRTIRTLRRRQDTRTLAALEQRLVGSTLADETDWIPDLPPGGPCRDPDGPSLVLVAGDAWRSRQRSIWVDEILGALVAADLRPVVVLAPGTRFDPPGAGETMPRPGTVTWFPIDLGPSYPTDPPADRAVLDHAWVAAAAARTIRPARIVALVAGDQRGLTAGISLRDAVACPLAAVVAASEPVVDWPGTSARRLNRADRVIRAPDQADPGLIRALRGIADLGAPRRVEA
jgi:hypothetical protein